MESRLNTLLPSYAPGASTGKIFPLFDFLQIPFCFLHMQLRLLGHTKSSSLMADLTWCSLPLKAPKLDQVAQGFGQLRTSQTVAANTACPGSQSQYLVTLTVKKFFLAFIGISLAVFITSHLCSCVCLALVNNLIYSRRLQLNSPVTFLSEG